MNPSFVHGVASTVLKFQTIGEALDEAAATWGSREALVVRQQNVRWSYTELKERAEALAAGLLSLGLEPGDRVGIWAPNCSEWTATQFATAKAGLILVNINPAYRVAELEFALNKVGCKALVTAASFKTSDYLAMLATLEGRLPHLKWKIRTGSDRSPGFRNLDELYGGSTALPQGLQPDDPINIQFTSGTTGLPKGATLSHFNILNNGYFVARAMRLSERDRMCIPVPLYHCFGMVMGNLGCLTHGATMVYPNDGFEPRLTLEAIAEEHCTVLYGVPTMFIAELEHPQFASFDLTSLRTGIMAGAPCPIEVMKRVIKDMHMREVTIAYGMTETSPVSFQ
ncbi:MAG TPA: AMP-binding protein, partial [Burkholderiales bacterium]|nr:AMP-binding protein [Burkholderiales bacterium]